MTRDRRGTVALEFALVAPFVLTLIFALLDLGRLLGDQHALDAGVAVAARYAIVSSASASAAAIEAKVFGTIAPLLGACGTCTVTVTFAPSYQPGGTVTVAASYPWVPSTPISLLPAHTLASSSTLTVQN